MSTKATSWGRRRRSVLASKIQPGQCLSARVRARCRHRAHRGALLRGGWARSHRGALLGLAAGLPLGRVRVAALLAVVVAVREGEGGAEALLPEGVRGGEALVDGCVVQVLGAGHHPSALDEGPGSVEAAAVAAVGLGVEAHVLGAQGHGQGPVRGDAHAVRRRRSRAKGPAAACICHIQLYDDTGSRGVWQHASI